MKLKLARLLYLLEFHGEYGELHGDMLAEARAIVLALLEEIDQPPDYGMVEMTVDEVREAGKNFLLFGRPMNHPAFVKIVDKKEKKYEQSNARPRC